MLYRENDLFIVDGVEAKVRFINSYGEAYLFPINDGEPGPICLCFSVLDEDGFDKKTGKKALVVNNTQCGAV